MEKHSMIILMLILYAVGLFFVMSIEYTRLKKIKNKLNIQAQQIEELFKNE